MAGLSRFRLPRRSEDLSVPMHVISFSEDVQTAPSMCKVVSDLAPNGVFHEIPGLGHVSMARHKPDVVATKIREIILSTAPS